MIAKCPSFSRWILSHKLAVLLAWVVLTIGGAARRGAGVARAHRRLVAPDREGWATNATIARLYFADPGGSAPLLAVVTLRRDQTVRSPGVREQLGRVDARLRAALPGTRVASFASTGDSAFLSRDRRTVLALVYPRADPDAQFGENPLAARGRATRVARRRGRGPAGAPDGVRRAGGRRRRRLEWSGAAARGGDRRRRRGLRGRDSHDHAALATCPGNSRVDGPVLSGL